MVRPKKKVAKSTEVEKEEVSGEVKEEVQQSVIDKVDEMKEVYEEMLPEPSVVEEVLPEPSIVSEPEIKIQERQIEEWEPLWCGRCQRGIIRAVPDYKTYSSGDKCPLCVEKHKYNHIPEDQIEILKTVKEYEKEYLDNAEMEKKMRNKGSVKAVKGAKEIVAEVESKMKSKLDAQANEIDLLKEQLNQVLLAQKN